MGTPSAGASRERRRHPEGGPAGGLVVVLSRWEAQGGRWRVLDESDAWLTVGLMSGEDRQISRVTGSRTAVLTAFLEGR